jgi:limonene 1,2-monooxygenase
MSFPDAPLRFGAFIAPKHFPGRNPTLALRRDLELISLMDDLGYDEVFVGEHHSGGVEIVPTPEIVLAAAAERTKRIRLGTGVASVPYHHPLMLADRIVLLDHLSGGRAILGVGPGALPTDAHMMGLPVEQLRHRTDEGFEALQRLLHSNGPVTMKTDWFELNNAALNLAPLQWPVLETAVAAVRSPSGPRLAGKFGSGLISLAATDPKGGFDFLQDTWAIVEDKAKEHGQKVDRSTWRLCAPMHIAETEEMAREQVKWGYYNQMRVGAAGPFAQGSGANVEEIIRTRAFEDLIDEANESGSMVIGTPEMAKAQIQRLQKQTGGFGSLLIILFNLAEHNATKHSLELFAQDVIPDFNNQTYRPMAAWERLYAGREITNAEFRAAQDRAIEEHKAEVAAKAKRA